MFVLLVMCVMLGLCGNTVLEFTRYSVSDIVLYNDRPAPPQLILQTTHNSLSANYVCKLHTDLPARNRHLST